ncbi:hypothetical protein ACRU3B_10715 [Mycobacterium colombiense]
MQTKTHEARVRRAAKHRGYLLRKSRARNPHADDYGLYAIVTDTRGNRLPGAAAAPNALRRGEGATLSAIEAELAAI